MQACVIQGSSAEVFVIIRFIIVVYVFKKVLFMGFACLLS